MKNLFKAFLLVLFLITFGINNLSAQTNDDCLMCHEDATLTKVWQGKTVSLFVDKRIIGKSVHRKQNCIGCHPDAAVADFPHPENLKPVNCGLCHKNQKIQYDGSLHGLGFKTSSIYAPDCKECHGKHDIISSKNPESRTYKMNIPFLCGRCHKEGSPIARIYNITEQNILGNYSEGIHGIGLFKKGLTVTATCNDCHGNHAILPHTNPKSSIAHENIATTCMKCHARIESVHKQVIKQESWEKTKGVVPACSECHPPHIVKIKNITETISDQSCIKCHENQTVYKIVDNKKIPLRGSKSEFLNTAHQNISCTKCHNDATLSLERPCSTSKKVDCSACHNAVADTYFGSGHGKAYLDKKKNSPYCTDCHGTHVIKSRKDETSPIYRGTIPDLCGKCHRKAGKATEFTSLKEVDALFDYSSSVHGKGLKEKGLLSSAVCTDCHTSHNVQKDSVPTSSINPKVISKTCAACHKSIYEDYIRSDHNILNPDTTKRYPNCADCHSAHKITEIDKDMFITEVAMQCGKCHEKLSRTYLETYHGKAYQLGYYKSAKCSDCHGSHKILNVNNPNSSVSRKNIQATCQKCHINATAEFSSYLTHATHKDKPALQFIFIAMTTLLISVFTIFGIHTLLWLPRSIKERRKRKHFKPVGKATYFVRFTRNQRLTHIFVIISFLLLALTGMILKFAHMDWASTLSNLLGGVKNAGLLHRLGAIITFGYFSYHVYSLIQMKKKTKGTWMAFIFGPDSLMFNKQDWKDLVATVKWFFGKGERPQYGRWTYWEKFDYMAVFWGVAVIGFSGLVLWFPVFFTTFLPGWFINIAQIIHSDEALLAVGFIFTIHFFNTHMRPEAFPMDTVIFTGVVPVEEYKNDRQREVQELEDRGELDRKVVDTEVHSSWLKLVKIFGFTALFIGIVLVLLIIFSLLFGKY